ncbi:MAG: metal-dependent hydrolase, partial [Chloroflexota bacterium]
IPMHSALGCAVSTALALALGGRRLARGWLAGYLAHLACDELNAHLNPGRIYLWWPFRRYALHVGPTGLGASLHDFSSASLAVELVLTLLAVGIFSPKAQRHKESRKKEPE